MTEPTTPQVRLHAVFEGRVQGVGFRYFVQRRAAEYVISGWVRNRWDGSVELAAEGDRSELEALLLAIKKGPPSAHVSAIKPAWREATGELTGFRIRRTA